MNPRNFFTELKRRNVYKVAVAYGIVAWLLIQIATATFPVLEIPNWATKLVIAVVLLGFPLALIFAWAFELTPEGVKRTEDVAPEESITRTTGRKLTVLVAGVALVALGMLLFQLLRDKTQPAPAASATMAAPSVMPEKSIAVLPFESLSEDKANAYFATGVQDEILTRLAKVGDLKVISRTSTQQYQSKPGNVAEIAKQLGVSHILEGSVQKAGESVRVNVQLIKADTDTHLWAETYDGKLTDIFAVQSDVARKIAASLEAKLTGREKEAIDHVGTKVPAAYEAYLRGLALRNTQSRPEQDQLIAFCRQAVTLDPNYAEAWAELANAEGLKYVQTGRTEAQKALAREAAENALRLDPNHGNGRAAMGMYLYYCLREFDAAIRELQQAQQQAPNDPLNLQGLGLVKRRQGKLEESIDLQTQAARLDPLNQDIWVNIAWTYRGMRRFAEARTMYDRALAIAPNDRTIILRKADTDLSEGNLEAPAQAIAGVAAPFGSRGYGAQINIMVLQRRYDEAIAKLTADLQQADAQTLPPFAVVNGRLTLAELYTATGRRGEAQPLLTQAEAGVRSMQENRPTTNAFEAARGNNSPEVAATMLAVHAQLGRREEVERAATAFIAEEAKDRWGGPRAEEGAARAFCIVGDHERALSLLEGLITQSYADSITPSLLRMDPVWDPIRNDLRFQKLAGDKP